MPAAVPSVAPLHLLLRDASALLGYLASQDAKRHALNGSFMPTAGSDGPLRFMRSPWFFYLYLMRRTRGLMASRG